MRKKVIGVKLLRCVDLTLQQLVTLINIGIITGACNIGS